MFFVFNNFRETRMMSRYGCFPREGRAVRDKEPPDCMHVLQ